MISGIATEVERLGPRHSRIAARLFNTALLIAPGPCAALVSAMADDLGVAPLRAAKPFAAIDRRGERGDAKPYTIADGVATIAVRGELVNHGSWINAESGLVSYDGLQKALRQAEADPQVMGIMLDVDSPGGEAAGATETADLVRAVAAGKPVVAYVNGLALSAAYAIAAGATEIVAAPSATLGSIGVVYLHLDRSKAMEKAGLKPTLIFAGEHKIAGNSLLPIGAAGRDHVQQQVDDVYSLLISSIGKHRPRLGVAGARRTNAGLYFGRKAADAGLADRIGVMSDALEALRRRTSAAKERVAPSAAAPSRQAVRLPMRNVAAPSTLIEAVALQPSGRSDAPATADEGRARALAAARDSGVRTEDIEVWVAAYGAAALAERARIVAILDCEAVKGRDALARRLALDTTMTVSEAVALLSAAPGACAPQRQVANRPTPVFANLREFDEAMARGDIGAGGATLLAPGLKGRDDDA